MIVRETLLMTVENTCHRLARAQQSEYRTQVAAMVIEMRSNTALCLSFNREALKKTNKP